MASLGRDRNGALPYEPAAGPRAREWAQPLWLGPALLVLVRARWLRFGTADRHACAINSQHAMLVRIPSGLYAAHQPPRPPLKKLHPRLHTFPPPHAVSRQRAHVAAGRRRAPSGAHRIRCRRIHSRVGAAGGGGWGRVPRSLAQAPGVGKRGAMGTGGASARRGG